MVGKRAVRFWVSIEFIAARLPTLHIIAENEEMVGKRAVRFWVSIEFIAARLPTLHIIAENENGGQAGG